MVTIAITGGLGYMGSGIAHRLLEAGDDVVIVDNGREAKIDWRELAGLAPDYAGLDVYTNDVTDRGIGDAILGDHDPDVVLHLAARTGVEACAERPEHAWKDNVDGTVNVARWCKNTGTPMALASTAGVYHPSTRMPLTPDRPQRPPHFYGKTKRAAEGVVEAFLAGAAPSLSIEMTNLYGSHDVGETTISKRTALNFFADRAREGDTIPVHKPGVQARDFLHVQDAVRGWHEAVFALLRVTDGVDGHERVILGSGEQVRIKSLAELAADTAAEQLGVEPDVELVENPRPGPYYGDLAVELATASEVLDGWLPQRSVAETIEEEVGRVATA